MAGSGASAAVDCDTQTGPDCRSTPFPPHRPDPAIQKCLRSRSRTGTR